MSNSAIRKQVSEQSRKKAKKKLLVIVSFLLLVAVLGVFFMNRDEKFAPYVEKTTARPVAGNLSSPVVFTEFSDLQCPACQYYQPFVSDLKEEFGDQVKFEWKHFPLQSIHPFAFSAAVAAECAQDQGLFWEYIEVAFANQEDLRTDKLVEYAVLLGVNETEFESCIHSDVKKKYVSADITEGNRRQVQGTPSFFVNGVAVQARSYADLKTAVEQAIAKNRPITG